MAEEFHDVDRAAVLEDLDELSRPLFGVSGHSPRALLAAIYVEAARRAGVSLCLLSSGDAWFAGILCGDEAVLLDPAWTGDTLQAELMLRCHCAHELAHALLCSLTCHFRALGSTGLARRAAELRLELPLGEELLARARSEPGQLEREGGA